MDHLRRLTIRLTAVALFGMLPQAGSAADDQPKTWGGLGFGIGIATDFNVSGGTRLGTTDTAVAVVPAQPGGIVRVNEARNVGVGVVLEAHYFLRDYLFPTMGTWRDTNCRKLTPEEAKREPVDLNCTELGHGPFVAIEVGSGTGDVAKGPVTAYALGWMVGMRHPNASGSMSNVSWNFGVGFRIEPGARFLGEGIVANQPLPLGETVSPVRTRSGTAYGVMLLSSFGFTSGL
jgi:hypothetical protein